MANNNISKTPPNFNYNPEIWGPYYWFFLHTVALNYPNYPNAITKRIYYDLFHRFDIFIPNADISAYYRTLLDRFPVQPYLDDRASLTKWVHFIHNRINKRLEKSTITLDEFLNSYYRLYEPRTQKAARALSWRQRAMFGTTLAAILFCTGYYLYGRHLRFQTAS